MKQLLIVLLLMLLFGLCACGPNRPNETTGTTPPHTTDLIPTTTPPHTTDLIPTTTLPSTTDLLPTTTEQSESSGAKVEIPKIEIPTKKMTRIPILFGSITSMLSTTRLSTTIPIIWTIGKTNILPDMTLMAMAQKNCYGENIIPDTETKSSNAPIPQAFTGFTQSKTALLWKQVTCQG